MPTALAEQAAAVRSLLRCDQDPRVRHRAHALLLVAGGEPVARVARPFRTEPHRVRAWRARFLADGRRGLADLPRSGRPPKLDGAALELLATALEAGPQAYGLPVTVWSVRDLRELLAARLGVRVCVATVHRALLGLGYRYRRPRHDLKHRQDAEAVAAAARVLDWLKKTAPETLAGFDWSTSTNVRSTATHGWRRSGSGGGSPAVSPPPVRTRSSSSTARSTTPAAR